uniref:Uncharacterized protein n=1 Tax=Lutzomyia longipalpis TaxID=7200 RepID=A0A1B0CGQ0_LUTLO
MTPGQKRVMEAYMEQYPLVAKITNRSRQDRIRQNCLWDKLVAKLNALGPPSEIETDASNVKESSETVSIASGDLCPDTSSMDTGKPSPNPRIRMKKYFDCFSESVLGLPERLQLKCRNEIFAVIAKYEEIANNSNQ